MSVTVNRQVDEVDQQQSELGMLQKLCVAHSCG
jgi:hypothetical protein